MSPAKKEAGANNLRMTAVIGLPASPGVAIGPAWLYRPVEITVPRRYDADPRVEWRRVRDAVQVAETQLQRLAARTEEAVGESEAAIFEAHQLFLHDPDLHETIQSFLDDGRVNAEAAVADAIDAYAGSLAALEDEYFRARAADVRDVGRRLIAVLAGVDLDSTALPDNPVVVFAEDLAPSDTVQFDRDRLAGLVTIRGGPTSHTAILARSLGIPAVVSTPFTPNQVQDGMTAVVDGSSGEVILNPDNDALQRSILARGEWQRARDAALAEATAPAVTSDGHRVEVVANVGNLADARHALRYGAEGIGLFRTEFLFLDRETMPSEAEQVAAYNAVLELMEDRPAVVRTLDIGGDKAVPYIGFPAEPNPFLGWRAIRMIDRRPDVLRTQFRALLRAGVGSDLRIMVPMVSQVSEVLAARALLDEAQAELTEEGLPQAEQVQFGIMVEVPAAALITAHIAAHVDFFSIGTNDLTQYTLAVDRLNERVAHLASPYHPAVLQLIALTISAAHTHDRWVGLCGEFAGDPLAAPLLLGLGLDEFSMAPTAVPAVKAAIRRFSVAECRAIATHCLDLPTADEVRSYLVETAQDKAA